MQRIQQNIQILLLGVISWINAHCLTAQDCPQPVVSSISPMSIASVHVDWFVNTNEPTTFDIEMVLKDSSFMSVPTVSGISTSEYLYTGLLAGKSYKFNIRTKCAADSSTWNGPYFFNTDIDNKASDCNLSFDISDDSCPSGDEFRIFVEGFNEKQLGNNIFLSNVALMIDHPWPPDLKIELTEPSGKSITLSQHKGLYARHFGNPDDELCNQLMSFSDLACSHVNANNGQLIGSFIPDQSISDLYANQSPDGVWTLGICDRANGDEGLLKHIELSFNEITCAVPKVVSIEELSDTSVKIAWTQTTCEEIKLSYGLRGIDPLMGDLEYVDCDSTSFVLNNLVPDTEYDIYINAECSNQESPYSCPFPVKTLCSIPLTTSSFDRDSICDRSCLENCDISGVWTNARYDDLDWKVNSRETPTLFTGPDQAIHNVGHYIYLENQTEICNTDAEAILISSCLRVSSLYNGCDMSFWYHMNGIGINRLSLEILVEGSQSWEEILSFEGAQNTKWQQHRVDFSAYDGKLIRLRFLANTGANNFADIALDEIVLSGLESLGKGISYFKDSDQDGYGNADETLIICSSIPIPNHVTNGEDCDDTNASINPGMDEILCNLLDDNCNGMADDIFETPLEYELISVNPEACFGSSDGSINLEIISGTAPYEFAWSNGMLTTAPSLFNLREGLYNCTINDASGCISITDSTFVDSDHQLLISVQTLETPDCLGADDGAISIIAGNGVPPYEYQWNNGESGSSIDHLPSGLYWASVSDAAGCQLITETFDLSIDNSLDAGVEFIKHIDCFANQNGVIRVNANSGTEPFEYQWAHGPNTAEVSQLSRGLYTVTIIDAMGCEQILKDIEIKQPDRLEIVVNNIENNLCYNNQDGSIQVTAIGGEAPYSFLWSNGSLNDDISNLSAGFYALTVSDINGCSYETAPIRVTEGEELTIEIDSISNSTCIASTDAYLSIDVAGGSGAYTYYWSDTNFVNTAILANVVSNFYSVTVVDELGCKNDMQNIFVSTEANELEVTTSVIQPLDCFGDSNAIINIQVDSEELPLLANWDFGSLSTQNQSNFNKNGISSGSYTITITDNNGCVGIDNIMVDQPDQIVLSNIEKKNNLCYGDSLGEIRIEVQGGTGDKTLTWFHGYNGDFVDQLPNGPYKLIISDEKNCQIVSEEIIISSPDILSFEAVITDSSPAHDGEVQIFPQGGKSPYRFKWDDSEVYTSNNHFSQLSPGLYPLSIIDQNNCVLDTIIELGLINPTFDTEESLFTRIYPNPSDESIHIESSLFPGEIKIYDTNGSLVYSTICESTTFHNSLGNLVPGVYYLVIHPFNKKASKAFKILRF